MKAQNFNHNQLNFLNLKKKKIEKNFPFLKSCSKLIKEIEKANSLCYLEQLHNS